MDEYMLSAFIEDLKSILRDEGDMPVVGYAYSETERRGGLKNPENWSCCVDVDTCPDKDGKKYAVVNL